jgi:hypothetical protein
LNPRAHWSADGISTVIWRDELRVGIIDRIFHQNRNIKWFKTLISIRRIKHASRLPVL